MAAQAQPRTRPGQQARPGDVTGRKREVLAREQAEEVQRRENEMTMITAERQRAHSEDVIDPETREVIKPDGSVQKMDNDDDDDAPRLIGTGDMKIEELVEPERGIDVRVVDPMEKVVIRVNCDLDEVTLGYGNVYSFKEGGKYRVPRWVADHLEDKGLLWH